MPFSSKFRIGETLAAYDAGGIVLTDPHNMVIPHPWTSIY